MKFVKSGSKFQSLPLSPGDDASDIAVTLMCDVVARVFHLRFLQLPSQNVHAGLQAEDFTLALLNRLVGLVSSPLVLLVVNLALRVGRAVAESPRRLHAEATLVAIVEVRQLAVAVVVLLVQMIVINSVVALVLKQIKNEAKLR